MQVRVLLPLGLLLASFSYGLNAAVAAPSVEASDEAVPEAVIKYYKKTLMSFTKTLQGELKGAIESGGPTNAISVCHSSAPKIAEEASQAENMHLSRVSLKNRNPNNEVVAGSWQESVLQQFEQRKAAGEDPMQIDYAATQVINGVETYAYMKAIPTPDLCLTCHGADVKPEVQAKLSELYPEDKAVGYAVGDLRGAFLIMQAKEVALKKVETAQ
ncbi:Tll0287-like domain-containing protein [Thioflexithrix psekupsensis]|uniref:Tll0287-like domain-containing protein n=1 Tax=Thioflexithrix psekupsensis TaxID=1570016 RepID=A0A251XB95_9GAMM|nr:DUF3365 domain-containing protein [Thioflexithrix psekupsensis]OUD15346.1 hypothetical protein TPSD3_02110 [Thioflexithrix psekupsensis]